MKIAHVATDDAEDFFNQVESFSQDVEIKDIKYSTCIYEGLVHFSAVVFYEPRRVVNLDEARSAKEQVLDIVSKEFDVHYERGCTMEVKLTVEKKSEES